MTMGQNVVVIILTGGRSSRLAGRHKPGVLVGGRTIIDRTVSTVRAAWPEASVVVVGSSEGLSAQHLAQVLVVREEPNFAGPMAGLAAGLDAVSEQGRRVVVLGGDMPFLSASTLKSLAAAVTPESPLVGCVDGCGQVQYLCTAWYEPKLRAQLGRVGRPDGVRLGALFEGLTPQLIDCDPDELCDIDTPDDLARAMDEQSVRGPQAPQEQTRPTEA